ncbi:hypothetical protein [Gelidibacter salicanalis]|uniref:Uncharacterized protein n=1 Tax=Gelidibacter salicanalis TaxID=291193 RepID=A0A934KYE2_9FLAO|nr:hypothetical protein [Gelidibacter salicanalis]MBJ7882683.1 hypothetical protein [Gelidibacter salicanalis]
MRTNNAKVKNIIVSVYFILIVLAIVLATVFSAFSHLTSNPFLTFLILLAGFLILFFSVHAISKFFEYDSDGVKVVVLNKGLLLSEHFNYREHKLEFDKDRLIAFKFKNYIVYKSLTFYIKNSKGQIKKETFNVTLIPKKKRRYISQSLSKIVKNNIKPTP